MKNKIKKPAFSYPLAALLIVALVAVFSCNKELADKKDFSNNTGGEVADAQKQKVLYIIVDGARGESIFKSPTPNLSRMIKTGMFTINSVSDENGLNSTSWADMLTGYDKTKHKVISEDFANNKLTDYPMFFKRVKDNTALRTAAFSISQSLSSKLISNADVNSTFATDEAVKTATLTELANNDAAVVLAEFQGVDKAGAQYGYDASVPQYAAAITNIDTYIGELNNAIKARASFSKENWLIVIASNKGGNYPVIPALMDQTLYSKPLLNSFVILYNPIFKSTIYNKPTNLNSLPYYGSYGKLSGDTLASVDAVKSNAYNFGTTGEYTVEFKLKVQAFGTLNAPIFFKTSSPANATTGWWIIHNGSNGTWRLGGLASAAIATPTTKAMEVNTWYNIGFKVYFVGTVRYVQLYQDGDPVGPATVITGRNANNSEPLVAGYRSGYGNSATQFITDVRIFNAAVPDAIIKDFACQVDLDSRHPNYNNLIGYWPSLNGAGTLVKDYSKSKNDFVFQKSPQWINFEDYDSKFCIKPTPELYQKVPRGIDIPRFILGWLNINATGFNLDGKVWTPIYNNILK
ncbi:DUF4983 domain-containing protein [Pedobacter sp. HDW13]|uniref:alkaline phosphatase family protein n=1 Tax=unclassified Pedobacter TaxID=2628915 RepID=UPI000F5AA434|nr:MULTISPECIES: alkaline phosphatase family protein [unclassified Pedobacter]QIL39389.1 DUF4983 domain-containing protein [Pedobacter sp. HDW13]RQO71032.1 hypothetical protein DBR40_17495 [Pedobacter sp. KBW01]